MVQNAAQTLVMRYVRVRPGDMFVSTTAVVMSESVKLLTCLLIIFYERGFNVLQWWTHLSENIFQQPLDCLKISVPAVVYMLQNNLLYVAASNLDAATYQVIFLHRYFASLKFYDITDDVSHFHRWKNMVKISNTDCVQCVCLHLWISHLLILSLGTSFFEMRLCTAAFTNVQSSVLIFQFFVKFLNYVVIKCLETVIHLHFLLLAFHPMNSFLKQLFLHCR